MDDKAPQTSLITNKPESGGSQKENEKLVERLVKKKQESQKGVPLEPSDSELTRLKSTEMLFIQQQQQQAGEQTWYMSLFYMLLQYIVGCMVGVMVFLGIRYVWRSFRAPQLEQQIQGLTETIPALGGADVTNLTEAVKGYFPTGFK